MRVSNWSKDMAINAAFANDSSCETPLFTLTQPIYREALASGLGEMDTGMVFEVLKAKSSV
jgi:3-hydroxyisobutyrate dehydrogenase-like beta-hydroxyacid dehydrogenase